MEQERVEPSQQVFHQPGILTLLMSQQSELRPGIKVTFSHGVKEDIQFNKTPYHYCAASGNLHLAAYLYSQGVPFDSDMRIATFAADGLESRTPWKKVLANTVMDTALMAGHAKTARILQLMHDAVPLHWSRTSHHLYPDTFRQQAKEVMQELFKVSSLYLLPGPGRVQVVDRLMTQLAQELVWKDLSPQVWKEQWQDIVGDPYEQAQTLPEQQDVPAVAQPAAEDVDLATFQFQLRANAQPPSTTQAMVRAAIGFAVGKLRDDLEEMKQNQHEVLVLSPGYAMAALMSGLAAKEVAKSWGSKSTVVNAAAFLLGAFRPAGTTLLVGLSTMLQQRLPRHRQ